jgi:hypothetical protein
METAISEIHYLPDFLSIQSVSPAIVNRATGELYINQSVWNKLSTESKLFILLHEAGHATLQTECEHEADAWAFERYAELGYPLTESIYALSRVLKFNKPEDYDRLQSQLQRAASYDYYTNNNQKAKDMILPDFYKSNNLLFSASDGDDFGPMPYDYNAGLTTSTPGANLGAWLNNVGSGLNSLAQAFATGIGAVKGNPTGSGSGASLSFPGSSAPEPNPEPEKDYTWLWIGIAVAAVVAVAITVFVIKQSKK